MVLSSISVALLLMRPVRIGAAHLPGTAQQKKTPAPRRNAPRLIAEVSPIEVKVQAVTTTAPTPSGNVSVVTLDLNQPTEFGTGLTEMLVTALVKSDHFIVLEKSSGSALTGSTLSPQITVKGAITELKIKRAGSGLGGKVGEQGSFSESKVETTVGLDLRVIEVSTGRILDSFSAQGKATSRRKNLSISKDELSFGTSSFEEGALGGAVRDAIKLAVDGIISRADKVEWEARVVDIEDSDEGKQIYINVGGSAGVAVGTVLEVRRAGRVITDPDTKLIIGKTKGKRVGRIKVVEVQEQLTICSLIEGEGFEKSDVVTMSKPASRSGGLK